MAMAVSPVRIGLGADPVEPRFAAPAIGAWKGIVIHASATAGGDPDLLHRQAGGSLYHFIIGNGQGMEDGAVHVCPAWDRQRGCEHVQPAAQGGRMGALRDGVARVAAATHANSTSISICLVGNGERRSFTDRQMQELVTLVRALQDRLGIPGRNVLVQSEIDGSSNPGQYFRQAEFESQLRP